MISIEGVSHTFAPGNAAAEPVLAEVDLEIGTGEFVSLVGASGCGKTTILNMIAGLLRPTSGRVLVSEQDAVCPVPGSGYMSAGDRLMPWRTTRRNVEFALESVGGYSRRQRADRAREMLQMVGLGAGENLYPSQLSHGMRQRANLARTLAAGPRLLLMDEPFGALDAQTKLHLQLELLRILENEPTGVPPTVVFVTHDLQEALLMSDRVLVMHPRPGRIVVDQRVDLPRPRSEHLKETMFSSEFRTLHERLFDQIETELVHG
jgi:NitT/TauT family transport system ATP-binding protein